MANSNSKLDKAQKADRKDMRERFISAGGTLHSFPWYGVTIGIMPSTDKQGDSRPRTAQMFVSLASNDEKKFRAKVGEYHLLYRWDAYTGAGAIIPNPFDPASFAGEMAATFNAETDFNGAHDNQGYSYDY